MMSSMLLMKQKNPGTVSITEGSIAKGLLAFFFPILFGSFFQQMYNVADAIIVGRFVGKEALAAVGGGTSVFVNLLVGFFVGITNGSAVVISQHFGAHDIYSIEDLRQLVYMLKEATGYTKPVIVKIAAVHNVSAIASGIARSGADIIAIDGFRGGTGAAPARIRDNVGIPIELALASVDKRLRDEGIRNNVSLVVGGSIRSSADVIKAIALGADAVYIATSALLALGCHLCRTCQNGKCNWGIATQRPELVKRLNPEIGSQRLVNLITACQHRFGRKE